MQPRASLCQRRRRARDDSGIKEIFQGVIMQPKHQDEPGAGGGSGGHEKDSIRRA